MSRPIIKELNYTKEEIAEVKRIQSTVHLTKKKDMIRDILKGPPCCICHVAVPTKRVEYDLSGVRRIETYCDEHFPIYERNKDVSLSDIAERYNCTITGPDSMKGIQGYSLTPA